MTNKWQNILLSFLTIIVSLILVSNAFIFHLDDNNDMVIQTDTDGYARMLRVEERLVNNTPYTHNLDSSNHPYGADTHWTMPFDNLLITLTKITQKLSDFNLHTSIELSGFMISQILLYLSIIISVAFLKRNFTYKEAASYLFTILTASFYLSYFGFGRADHHSLNLFIFNLIILFSIKNKYPFLIGLLSAISLWIGMEGLIIILSSSLFFILKAISQDKKTELIKFAGSLLSFVTIFTFIEHQTLNIIAYDIISLVHILVAALILFIALGLTYKNNYITATILSLISATILYSIFPKFIHGPYIEANPKLFEIFFPFVSEEQSKFDIKYFIMPIISLYFMFAAKRKDVYLLIAFLLFLPLAFYSVRCITFLQLVSVYIIALSIPHIDSKKIFITVILYLAILSFLKFPIIKSADSNPKNKSECPVSLMLQYIDPAKDGEVLLSDYWSSLYYTWHKGYKSIGSPHHRNAQAIIYTYDVFDNPKTKNYKELLEERDVDKIILCKNYPIVKTSLRGWLVNGGDLKGYNRINLPEELNEYFIALEKSK